MPSQALAGHANANLENAGITAIIQSPSFSVKCFTELLYPKTNPGRIKVVAPRLDLHSFPPEINLKLHIFTLLSECQQKHADSLVSSVQYYFCRHVSRRMNRCRVEIYELRYFSMCSLIALQVHELIGRIVPTAQDFSKCLYILIYVLADYALSP